MLNKEASLKKRYIAKLSTNLIGMLIALVTQAIIPRGLGPKTYGNFGFLTNSIKQIIGFLKLGTEFCFYTNLSKRPREIGLVGFYFYFVLIASLLLIIFTVIAHITGRYSVLFPDQSLFFIYLAVGWGIISWGTQVLQNMLDAYALTVSTEIIKIFQKIIGLAIIVGLFLLQKLTLISFFLYHYFMLFVLGVGFVYILSKSGFPFQKGWILHREQIKNYFLEFYNYSQPLFIYTLLGLVVGVLDRWLLQYFSGSVEQGFYHLSYKIGAICFLFTSAMTPLITREFSIAFGNKDTHEMARIFRRYIPMLYAISAYFACFVAVQSEAITFILGGGEFSPGSPISDNHGILPDPSNLWPIERLCLLCHREYKTI